MGETILIVDDDSAILEMARMFLEDAGYKVLTAPDGHAGFQAFQDHQERIELLLTDIKMPGMDGHELADRARQSDPALVVLFMSGDFHDADRGSCRIPKPFEPLELISCVNTALKSPNRIAGAGAS